MVPSSQASPPSKGKVFCSFSAAAVEAVCGRYGMQPSLAKFSARAIKASWWLGTASLAFGFFIKITSELLEHEVSGADRTILIGLAKARTPWLTVVAVDLTALGSVTLVVLISTIALCVLLLLKDRMGAATGGGFRRCRNSNDYNKEAMAKRSVSRGLSKAISPKLTVMPSATPP